MYIYHVYNIIMYIYVIHSNIQKVHLGTNQKRNGWYQDGVFKPLGDSKDDPLSRLAPAQRPEST